jgi:NAD(P)-dependent dehydrogenase (short-subunit alcohol dehydrogenase family)
LAQRVLCNVGAMQRFEGRVAFVTGGASGMGRAIAGAFAAEGASVVVADIDTDGGQQTVTAIEERGGTAAFVHTDVADDAAVRHAVGVALERYGRLDHGVNAAAIEGENVPAGELEVERFDLIMAVNVRSVFLCMQHEIRAMTGNDHGGTIVNIASTNSYRPQPNQTAYTASKHAVLGLTRAAAVDYGSQGIRINAICPGAIDTPMLRNAMERRGRTEADTVGRLSLLGRFGQVDEIARAALWLSSDDSSYTVGHALAVDGGYLAR